MFEITLKLIMSVSFALQAVWWAWFDASLYWANEQFMVLWFSMVFLPVWWLFRAAVVAYSVGIPLCLFVWLYSQTSGLAKLK